MTDAPARLARLVLLAVGTLTVLRVPAAGPVGAAQLRASTALYPAVGAAVALAPAAVLLLPLPPLLGAALAVAAWVAATGALHVDGWADCCDAAFAPAQADPAADRARRLEILRDPRTGAFGATGIALLLLVKWSALATAPTAALAPLVAAPAARWVMVLALRRLPAARPTGLGATFAGRVPLGASTLLWLALLAPTAALAPRPAAALLAAVLAAAGGWGAARWLAGRFGGVTGDVCGAAGEAAEAVALCAWVALA